MLQAARVEISLTFLGSVMSGSFEGEAYFNIKHDKAATRLIDFLINAQNDFLMGRVKYQVKADSHVIIRMRKLKV